MSIKEIRHKKSKIFFIIGFSLWLAACSRLFEDSTFGGGEENMKAAQLMKDIGDEGSLSTQCFEKTYALVKAGLKARTATWMPTAKTLKWEEKTKGDEFVTADCPLSTLSVVTYALAKYGNTLERQRAERRSASWQ